MRIHWPPKWCRLKGFPCRLMPRWTAVVESGGPHCLPQRCQGGRGRGWAVGYAPSVGHAVPHGSTMVFVQAHARAGDVGSAGFNNGGGGYTENTEVILGTGEGWGDPSQITACRLFSGLFCSHRNTALTRPFRPRKKKCGIRKSIRRHSRGRSPNNVSTTAKASQI